MLGRGSHFGLLQKPSAKDINKVEEVMQRLHINHIAKKRCSEISGGELQMVLIARALASEPMVLILDEPESNLDFRNQLRVLQLLESLKKNKGLTIVFNTHYPDHALQIADHVLLLKEDGTCLYGNSDEILTEELLEEVFDVRIHTMRQTVGGKTYAAMIPLPKEVNV
jgi:iron complex transport system ATP-binding protein